ncbi:MAG: ankyrin repeat domain-containing protein, partial [Leptospiraceae bacterium]|nr:ankyrin repeat domain-containing protein [Leptospiraceae bacterium]
GRNGEGWIVFDSRLNKKDYDIGLIRTDGDGNPGQVKWITSTAARERIPRIQPLDDKLLLVWSVDTSGNGLDRSWSPSTNQMQTQIALIDKDGKLQIAPFFVPAGIRGATRLFSFPNGDVGWIYDVTGNGSKLEIVRISTKGSTVEVTDTNEQIDPDTTDTTDHTDAPVYDESLSLPLLQSAYRGDASAVASFLEKKANPDAQYQGWRPLHYAAYAGDLQICRLLVEAGADTSATVEGWTALQLATSQNHKSVAEYLSKNNARLSRQMPTTAKMPVPGRDLDVQERRRNHAPVRQRGLDIPDLPGEPRARD